MTLLRAYILELTHSASEGWQRFWFTPADTATLGLIRILAGAMLFYTHLVWSLDLEAFFGPQAWISAEAFGQLKRDSYMWTYLTAIDSTALLWAAHLAALMVFAALMLGLFSRTAAVLAYLIAVAYAHRTPAALFGLDQINVMLAMYLMIGPCGGSYSLDRWLAARRAGGRLPPSPPSVSGNVAIRLIQCHMCIIYLFAGLSKLSGESWWAGSALWLSFANLEYQSLDMTWMAGWPRVISLMTHISIAWEVSYCALVWPRLTRPLVIALAIPLHMGIAICLGMMTFGLVMLIGNVAFISPWLVRAAIDRLFARQRGTQSAGGDMEKSTARSRRSKHPAPAARRS